MRRTTPVPFAQHPSLRFTIAIVVAIVVSRGLPIADGLPFAVASAAAELACDTDGDGICDVDDPCPDEGRDDADGDGICAGARFHPPMTGAGDNCPDVSNADQANADGDDRGDACDLCPQRSGADEDACLGTGSWSSLAPSNTPRSESGFVACGDKLYVIGGEQTAASRSVEIYDPATDTWSNGPMLPSSRHHVAPVVIGHKIYLPGGLIAFPGPSLDENLVLDTDDLAAGWQPLAPLPTSRGALGCATSGVRIYCAGGLSSTADNMAIDVFEVYNTLDDTWTTLPPMPRPRDHFEPQIIDGKFYAIGGRDTSIAATYPFNDIYDIASGTWSLGAPIPTPRGGHATEIFEGRILVIGGEGNGPSAGTFPNVEEYDPVRDLWRTLADIPTPRHGFGAAMSRAADGVTPVLYAATGSPKQGFGFTTVTDRFEFKTCNGAIECDDGNPCTIDTCNAAGSCDNSPAIDGSACDDGLACTSSDTCSAGVCTGTVNCTSGSICNLDTGNCELPALVCIDAGSNPTGAFNGAMTKGPAYTGGTDDDPIRDSLTSQMLYANSTSNAPNGGSGDRVVYTFDLPFRGDWAMWGRFYYPNEPGSNQANSFLVGIDFGLLKKFGNNRDYFRQFHYDGDGNKESGPLAPIILSDLAKGSHKLTIEKREVQPIPPRLDVICFSQDLSGPPSDERVRTVLGGGGPTTTLPVVTTTLPVVTTTLPVVTTTLPLVTTTLPSPTTTLPAASDVLCWPAASGNSPSFAGAMTTSNDFTGGADADGGLDNLTAPLVFADSSANSTNGGSGDEVTYQVDLPAPGTWYLWGRFYYPGTPGSNDANSFLVRADAGAPQKLGNNKSLFQRWHYDGDGAVENGPVAPLSLGNLGAGAHTITVEKREVAPGLPPRLDVLCMTQDPATVPDDAVACEAMGGCGAPPTTLPAPTTTLPAPTTTLPAPTTTLPTTSTTLPLPDDVFCIAAGSDPTAAFSGSMTVGTAYTGGFDSDPVADNLQSPLVFADSAINATNGGSGDQVTYLIDLPTAGNWYLWGRFYYPGDPGSNQANSFLASVDGGLLSKFGNNRDYFQTWHFDGDGGVESGPTEPLFLGNLGAGAHVLKVEKREVTPIAPRLDVLCLTKDPFTQFTDEMACAELGGCGLPTTTVPLGSTTTTTLGGGSTTTTLPPVDASLVCLAAGSDTSAVFSGAMTADSTFTAGADFDALADSLTSSLAYAASAVNAFNGGSGDEVAYTMTVPSSGRWYLWARMYYPGTPGSNDANSFFVSLDGGAQHVLGNKGAYFQTWHFDGDGSSSSGPAAPLDLGVLSAGPHQIAVAKREVVPIAPRLDVLCLSKDAFAPSDAEACTALGGCN